MKEGLTFSFFSFSFSRRFLFFSGDGGRDKFSVARAATGFSVTKVSSSSTNGMLGISSSVSLATISGASNIKSSSRSSPPCMIGRLDKAMLCESIDKGVACFR